jgi:glutathione S-transferase
MRVYHREQAGRPLRIIWTLEELDEPYELSVMTREQGKGAEHLARHPLGRVPVLEDDEGFVFESAALCLHLADLHPDKGLAPPPGTHGRALVYQWTCFAPAELEPPLFEAWIEAERDPERAGRARGRFAKAASVVDGALDGRGYLVGDQFTVADVLVGTSLLFTTRAGISAELTPRLNQYLSRLGERPAFQRALRTTFGARA